MKDLIGAFMYRDNLLFIISIIEAAGFIILIFLGIRLRRLIVQYRCLLRGNDNVNLEEILLKLGKEVERQKHRLTKLEEKVREEEEEARFHLQRWSLLRYKAFANTGGDQSFSLVLLDKNGDGIIISSIYGRDESRVYAKAVKEGRSNYPLSDEEQEVLARAMGNKTS